MANVILNKSKGPLINVALCRCCHSIKKCRLLTSEYEFEGSKEVYCDMFMAVFGLSFHKIDGENVKYCICATCVSRLREARDFRQQVLLSEHLFLQTGPEKQAEYVKQEVKAETVSDAETYCSFDSDSAEDAKRGEENERAPKDKQPEEDADEEHVDNDFSKSSNDCSDDSDTPLKRIVLKKTKSKGPKIKNNNEDSEKTAETIDAAQTAVKMPNESKPAEQPLSTGDKIRLLYTNLKKCVDNGMEESVLTINRQRPVDHNLMVLINTVTIVTYSYACPFRNRISLYYCYFCNEAQFTNPNELREHTMAHDARMFEKKLIHYNRIPIVDVTRIDCRLCGDKIDDIEEFKIHISSKHEKNVYPVKNEFLQFRLTLSNFTCTVCNAVYPFFDSLKKHMIDHFGTYTCDVCGACYLEHSALRVHLKSHSKVESSYPCEICGKNLKSKYSMGLHVATVHEKKPTVNCYKCDAAFLSYALRNRHLIEAHGDARTFPCKLCDKVFAVRKNLVEHHRRCHVRAYNHQCDVCARTFYLPSALRSHLATHSGDRRYECAQCDKRYAGRKSLLTHVMRAHKR